jgi:site-specific DNA-methyltransferase (adenine-specific)
MKLMSSIQEIWFGDCLDLMKNIENEIIDLVICDPPYGKTLISWDQIINFEELWLSYSRICKENSTIILFGSGVFTAKTICSKEEWFKYCLVWKKSKCGSPFLSKYRPMIKHEDILIFTKNGGKHKTFNPILTEGEPYKRTDVKYKKNNHKYGLKSITTDNKGTRYPTSILDFPQQWRRQDQVHPTQKPVELLEYLIKTYSNEDDLILDNCAGSGSTLVAAKNLKRQFIGIEKEKKYYDISLDRLNFKMRF